MTWRSSSATNASPTGRIKFRACRPLMSIGTERHRVWAASSNVRRARRLTDVSLHPRGRALLLHYPQRVIRCFPMGTVFLRFCLANMQALIVRAHKADRTDQHDQFLGTFTHQPLHMPAPPLASRYRSPLVQPTVKDSFHQLSAHGLTALDYLLFQVLQFPFSHLAYLLEKAFQLLFQRFAQYPSYLLIRFHV